jgi:lipoprotein-releasing system ATP-binding protein
MDLFDHSDRELSSIRNTRIGFVFQFHHLLSEFTCLENIALPAMVSGVSRNNACERAHVLLDRFGMGDKDNRLPEQLSGGEKQRVAIARALINDPLIILADEPTGNLDYENTAKLLDVFEHLKDEGHTIILVTHSLDIEKVATRVYNLKDGELNAM